MKRVILNKGKESSLLRFHPWVFSGAIKRIADGTPFEGEVVEVESYNGKYLGTGHYQIGSIAVRILSFEKRKIDASFWYESLAKAYEMRRGLGVFNENTTCYRLVHGEGDFLPGLVIDIYNGYAVLQAHSAGMFLSLEDIAVALRQIYGDRLIGIYDKSSGTAPFKAGLPLNDHYIWRSEGGADFKPDKEGEAFVETVLENGNRFLVDWVNGQKTGFFLDQRDNRALVRRYAYNKDVLNLFCYTGGFSIYALQGGAKSVTSVDSSKSAIELTDRNVALNGYDGSVHTSCCTDALDFMRNLKADEYNLMIVDPPAFAKHRGALDNALRAYKKLNALAIEKIKSGGIIFTYSCSQVVDKNAFALAVFSAAALAGRKVRILHRLTQPADHPVNIYHPEGEYLKGLVLYVE